VINFRKIGVHVRKAVDHLVTTSAVVLVEPMLRIRFRHIRAYKNGIRKFYDRKARN
jgi:hypothetical protein